MRKCIVVIVDEKDLSAYTIAFKDNSFKIESVKESKTGSFLIKIEIQSKRMHELKKLMGTVKDNLSHIRKQ